MGEDALGGTEEVRAASVGISEGDDDDPGVGEGAAAAASRTSAGRRTPKVRSTAQTYQSWRSSRPARNVGLSP